MARGHLAIHLYETRDPAILTKSDADWIAEVPNFLQVKSKMFNLTTDDNLEKYKNLPVGWDYRSHCITADTFSRMYANDTTFYMVVTTSTADNEGNTCVTITEKRDYPFYTIQYHVEQIMYDFSVAGTPHTAAARQFSEDVEFFFARETRNSINYFDSYIHVTYEYIYNFKHVYDPTQTIADLFEFHVISAPS